MNLLAGVLRGTNTKLLAAVGFLSAWLAVSATGLSVVTAARILAGAVLVAAAVWAVRKGRNVAADAPARSLRVVSRVGLGPRNGLSLIEAEGEAFLVAHGDGYARVYRVWKDVRRARSRRTKQALHELGRAIQ